MFPACVHARASRVVQSDSGLRRSINESTAGLRGKRAGMRRMRGFFFFSAKAASGRATDARTFFFLLSSVLN